MLWIRIKIHIRIRVVSDLGFFFGLVRSVFGITVSDPDKYPDLNSLTGNLYDFCELFFKIGPIVVNYLVSIV